jgi:hypothetical protein
MEESTYKKENNELVETKTVEVKLDKDFLLREEIRCLSELEYFNERIIAITDLLAETRAKIAKCDELGIKSREELEAENIKP